MTVKAYLQGTDRVVSPGETVEWVRPFLPDMGITRIANVTGLDVVGLPVVMVCRPNSRGLAVSQGKGMTLDAAKASGVMESIETYHAERVTLPLVLGTFEELTRDRPLVDAFGLPAGASGPFLADRPQLWVEGRDLISSGLKWVPLDAVHTDFTFDARLARRMIDPTSNGLASGNHRLEAISHALCELIERDATALWTLLPTDRRPSTRLDLETVDDPACREILDRLADAGIGTAVWDVTSGIRLPAFSCMIAENPAHAISPLYAARGHGCHPRREVALSRALSEAVQSRLTAIAGSRDDIFRSDSERTRDRHALDVTWATVNGQARGRSFLEIPTYANGSFEEDIALELASLQAVGIEEAVIVDLTRPEFGIPVVRAVVPGLESLGNSRSYRPGKRALAFAASLGAGQGPAMTVYVFSGPTLAGASGPSELDAVYLPPAEQGDVYRATLSRPAVIGIIDGRFQDVPAVWHKEILWALAQGVRVYGTGSMGALRAAELQAFGMRGVGWVFEAFRDGLLEDDDEVAVAHGSAETGFRPASDAMVNIRRTLSSAENAGVIDTDVSARLIMLIKPVFYPSRSYGMLLHLARKAGLPRSQVDALEAWLPDHQVDQKRIDAIEMLRLIRGELEPPPAHRVSFTFQHTQFFEQVRRSAGGPVPAGDPRVTSDDLLDELRLEPDAYARLRDRALFRCLALREFERDSGTLTDSDLQQAAEGFRRDRGLYDRPDIERWLADNDLTVTQFAALVREEHAARQVAAAVSPGLDIHIRSQLRSDGLYPRLADRARQKRLFLAAAGLETQAASQLDLSDEELTSWYFTRLGIAVPDDISLHWKSLGLDHQIAFMRMVLRDYGFAVLSGHSESGPVLKEEANGSIPQGTGGQRLVAAESDPGARPAATRL